MCGIVIEHRDGEVLSIKPNRDDVLSRGHICPKAVALKDLHEDPDRLRTPLRRTASGWEEISWAAAFDEIEARIGDIRKRHGDDAVAVYAGNPTVHNLGAMLGVGDFIRALRTKNLYSATSVDQLPHMVASWAMFGHQFLMPVPDVDRTQLFVCIGGNPVASGGSIMGAPGFEKRIDALRARGGRFVVVDPRRTESAAIADEYFGIRPGTDVYLLLALLHEVFTQGRIDLAHLAPHVDGLDALRKAVLEFDPQLLAARTSLPHSRIVALAHDLMAEPRALVYGRVGACTQEFGGLTLWLIYCLNAVTGHLDREGGMMFAEPAVDLTRAYGSRGHYGKFHSRVRKLPEFSNELPVAALAEEIIDTRHRPGACAVHVRGQPRAVDAERGAARRCTRATRVHGVDRPVPERILAARAPDPAADQPARAQPLRHRAERLRGSQRRQVFAAAVSASPRARCTITRSSRRLRGACARRRALVGPRVAARSRTRCRSASGPTARSTGCSRPGATACRMPGR